MIDIHSHILWGIDDGPRTLDESLAMLRVAAAAGTTDIVATPHANSRYPFDPVVIASRIEELRQIHIGPPRIHSGCDFHLSPLNIDDAVRNPVKYTINSGQYLMVELPESFSPDSIRHALHSLVDEGMLPVITHPERNPVLQRSQESIDRWIDLGCLVQITAQSLMGRFGRAAKRAAWQTVRTGRAHFIASDAHDVTDRPPCLDGAYELLRKEVGESAAGRLVKDHPLAAIENRDDEIDTAYKPQAKAWYRFFRTMIV
jgi:protein-tyrosine phosphatase